MIDFTVYKRVLVPYRRYRVTCRIISSGHYKLECLLLESKVLEVPCNPILSFLGLLRFDKHDFSLQEEYEFDSPKTELVWKAIGQHYEY